MASLRSSMRVAAPRKAVVSSRKAMVCRADAGYLGSTPNLIMISAISLQLAAGKFGFAPTVAKGTTSDGLKLVPRASGVGALLTNDPSGFTVVDVLAHGAVGHVIGVGAVLGLKAIGAI